MEKITHGRFKKLAQKYNEGGFEAIEKDIEGINHNYTMRRHTQYTLNMCNNAHRVMEDLRDKIIQRAKQTSQDKPFDTLPETSEINDKLLLALEDASSILFNAINKSEEILKNIDIDELIQ